MNLRPLALALAAAGLLGTSLGALARAEEPAPAAAAPKPLAKVKQPFLDSLVGSWDFAVTPAGGKAMKGSITWRKAIDDTAYVAEFRAGEGDTEFHGLGVMRVADDGKSLSYWWFDSMGGGAVAAFRGTATEDGYDIVGVDPGPKMSEGIHRVNGVLEVTNALDGKEQATGTLKKAEKPPASSEPDGGRLDALPFVKAERGDWTLTGTSRGVTYAGKSRIRLGVGGHYVLEDLELQAGEERHVGLGVASVSADGKTRRAWWFGNYAAPPLALAGTLTDTGWTGKGAHPAGGELSVAVSLQGKGMEAVYSRAGAEFMKTTYARPK